MPEQQDISDDEAARLWGEFLHGNGPRRLAAFERLYASFLSRVIRYCRFRLGDPDRAEDVANTVFVRLLEARPVLRSSFTGLVFCTARTLCANELAKRAIPRVIRFEPQDRSEPDPGSDLEKRDAHAALAECLERLPEPDQTLIVLHHGEGLTYRQIADCLGLRVALSGFTRRIKRIKQALLQCLKEKGVF